MARTAGPLDTTGHNASIFFDPKLPQYYAGLGLKPAEATFRSRHGEAWHNKALLDLGVGSGRTTRFFAAETAHYVGVDISEPMLAVARAAFPTATFLQMDLRAIAALGKESFDCVLGAFGILSAFTPAERLQLLADIHALLTPGGIFYFSVHNREWRRAGKTPPANFGWPPRRMAGALNPISWNNYLRLRHLRREEADYAVFNDLAHHWRGVFYYIDRAAQQRQLEAAGFTLLEIYGDDGRLLGPGDDVSADGMLHYVCMKAERPA